MPVFLGVLIHKSTHIRTQVSTLSVRMYGYPHVINSTETESIFTNGSICRL